MTMIQVFQSTPVIADGRTTVGVLYRPVKVFQSTPVIADGRTGCLANSMDYQYVSIHARHC